MVAIEASGLTKKFDGFTAVDSLDLEIKKGELFALLGPNGAGKTTTISMLSTLLKPTSGKALVNGYDVVREADDVRHSIGIVFQDQSLDDQLTARENLDIHGRLYHMPREKREKKVAEVLGMVDLTDRADSIVKTFSGGMRRRLEIARGLMHSPEVLFLDEPTIGLDVVAKENVRGFLREIRDRQGVTVILTTHDLGDIEQLCRRVIIIDKGKVHFDGELEDLRTRLGRLVRLTVDLREPVSAADLRKVTAAMPVTWREAEGKRHVAEFRRAEVSGGEVIRRVVTECSVSDLHLAEPDIEEIVRDIYRDAGRAQA